MKKELYDFDFDLEAFFDSLDLTLNYDDYDFSFDDIELDFNIEQWANKEKLFFYICWNLLKIFHISHWSKSKPWDISHYKKEYFLTLKKNNGQIKISVVLFEKRCYYIWQKQEFSTMQMIYQVFCLYHAQQRIE